jgi:hypothetical protein
MKKQLSEVLTNKTQTTNNKIKEELFPIFTQFFKIFDLLKFSKNDSSLFSSEYIKSFECLDFPSWDSFYPLDRDSAKEHLPFVSEEDLEKEMFQDFEDIDKCLKESPVFKQIRKLSSKEQKESKDGDEVLLTKEQAEILLSCYAWMNFSVIAAIFGKMPFELFTNAKKGDRDSILKLIQLDKSLIQSDWSMKEIKKAQLSGDQEYFKKLAKAITAAPFKSKKLNIKLSMVLVFGWEMGLSKLSNLEILEFVNELGVYEGDDPDSLYREVKRLGLRKRAKKERTE